jgi:hypothetical protein
MKTTELTVQLPEAEVQSLEAYAREHSLCLAELLAHFARRLQPRPPYPANIKFTGTVPANVDARAEHRHHLEKKH